MQVKQRTLHTGLQHKLWGSQSAPPKAVRTADENPTGCASSPLRVVRARPRTSRPSKNSPTSFSACDDRGRVDWVASSSHALQRSPIDCQRRTTSLERRSHRGRARRSPYPVTHQRTRAPDGRRVPDPRRGETHQSAVRRSPGGHISGTSGAHPESRPRCPQDTPGRRLPGPPRAACGARQGDGGLHHGCRARRCLRRLPDVRTQDLRRGIRIACP